MTSPSHYAAYAPLQPISACRHLSFNLGNALKYACRAPFSKDGVQDLEKGLQYLEWEIEQTGTGMDYSLAQRKAAVKALDAFSDQLVLTEPPLGMGQDYRQALSHFLIGLEIALGSNILSHRITGEYREMMTALQRAK